VSIAAVTRRRLARVRLFVLPNARTSLALLLLVTGALAACGEDRETATGTSTSGKTATETSAAPGGKPMSTLSVTEDEYTIRPAQFSLARPGVYEFDVRNTGKAGHALEVEGQGMEVETKTFGPGKTAKLKADLKPGTYKLYCPVANHEQLGMTAKLTVRDDAGTGTGTSTTRTTETDTGTATTETGEESGGTGY
jgi:uncharacterized cupredoxin-like copper-binding protein